MNTQMIRTFIILLFAFFLGISANASDMTGSYAIPTGVSTEYSPQVCQFSLTSYSGTISCGLTDSFKVGLSCPQKSDVRATVIVFINDEYVASKVVTIEAGEDYSDSVRINVGSSYNGQKYRLLVE